MTIKDKKILKQINKFIKINMIPNKSYSFQQGYKNFGILLLGMCEWIHNEYIFNNYSNLFFLARDGYILKKAYEIIYPNEKTEYLYVSRRSLILPSCKNFKDINEIMDSLVLPPLFNIHTILSCLGLNYKDVEKEINKLNISPSTLYERSKYRNDKELQKLLTELSDKISKNVEIQYHNFTNYLHQKNFEKNAMIVDIGWHNSIQVLLSKIDPSAKIYGLYLGIYSDTKHILNNAKGYLYAYGNSKNTEYKTFSFVSLLESFFLAHEGTTINYDNQNGIIVPNLQKYEYDDEIESFNIISDFQNGALQFIEDYLKFNNNWKINPNICSYNIIKMGTSPSKKDIKVYGSLSFENYQKKNIINFNHSTLFYMFHLETLKKDFYNSGWRIAFLKKMFKIPLPYNTIIKLICIIFKKEKS